jgi:hypothetical protein
VDPVESSVQAALIALRAVAFVLKGNQGVMASAPPSIPIPTIAAPVVDLAVTTTRVRMAIVKVAVLLPPNIVTAIVSMWIGTTSIAAIALCSAAMVNPAKTAIASATLRCKVAKIRVSTRTRIQRIAEVATRFARRGKCAPMVSAKADLFPSRAMASHGLGSPNERPDFSSKNST